VFVKLEITGNFAEMIADNTAISKAAASRATATAAV
jgi:hypothetical protein